MNSILLIFLTASPCITHDFVTLLYTFTHPLVPQKQHDTVALPCNECCNQVYGEYCIQHIDLGYITCRVLCDMLHHARSPCTQPVQPVTVATAAGPSALSSVVTRAPASQSANTCHERNTML